MDADYLSAVEGFLNEAVFMLPSGGPLVAGTLSFLEVLFNPGSSANEAKEVVEMLLQGFANLMEQELVADHFKEMATYINQQLQWYNDVFLTILGTEPMENPNTRPTAKDLKRDPDNTYYVSLMQPLEKTLSADWELTQKMYALANDTRYTQGALAPLGAKLLVTATSLLVTMRGRYAQLVSYRDASMSNVKPIFQATYEQVKDVVTSLRQIIRAYRSWRRGQLGLVNKTHHVGHMTRGAYDSYSLVDAAGASDIPPSFGQMPETEDGDEAQRTSNRWHQSVEEATYSWEMSILHFMDVWADKFLVKYGECFPPTIPHGGLQIVYTSSYDLPVPPSLHDEWSNKLQVQYGISLKNKLGQTEIVAGSSIPVRKWEGVAQGGLDLAMLPAVVASTYPSQQPPSNLYILYGVGSFSLFEEWVYQRYIYRRFVDPSTDWQLIAIQNPDAKTEPHYSLTNIYLTPWSTP